MTAHPKKKVQAQIHIDPSLKTIWIDNFHLAKRDDGINCFRLCTNLPEGTFEQGRFMTSDKNIKKLIDMLCANLDHYPKKQPPARKK